MIDGVLYRLVEISDRWVWRGSCRSYLPTRRWLAGSMPAEPNGAVQGMQQSVIGVAAIAAPVTVPEDGLHVPLGSVEYQTWVALLPT